MINKMSKIWLLLGLLIKVINGIGGHYKLFSDFGKGFLDGIAIAFLLCGLVVLSKTQITKGFKHRNLIG